MDLPRGFKFKPSDEDCLFYLKEKISGNPMPVPGMILECNPYDEAQLPGILAAVDRKDLYIFTKLRRMGTNAAGKNAQRRVGDSTWHVDSKPKKILDERRQSVIGMSRVLSYLEQKDSITRTNHKRCLMTEYRLPPHDNNYDMFKDWVLCRLAKNGRWKNGKKVVGHRSASCSAAANSPTEEEEVDHQATPPSGLPPEQTLAASGIMNYGPVAYEYGPSAANSGFPPEAINGYYPYARKVDQAMLINNLPVVPAAVEIPPTQAIVAFGHWDDQVMANYYNHNSYTYCEAQPINNVLPLEYYTTTTAAFDQIPSLNATSLVVEHGNYSTQVVLDNNSCSTQLEATPSSVTNDLHAELSPAVLGIQLAPQCFGDFEDGNDELGCALMAMEFEDQIKPFDRTMDSFLREDSWITSQGSGPDHDDHEQQRKTSEPFYGKAQQFK